MKELVFLSKKGNGGFGDRLVGIVSCYLIAKKYNLNFKIFWDVKNIDELFNNISYIEHKKELKNIRLIDEKKSKKAKDFLINILPKTDISYSIESNMNWHFFIYDNRDILIRDTKETYNILLNDILGVNREIVNKILQKYTDISERIGIQIRTGDQLFEEKGALYIPNSKHVNFCNNLANVIIENYQNDKKLFVTADNPEIINELKKIIGNKYDILTTSIGNIHIDKNELVEIETLINLFEEFFLLSSCKEIIGCAKKSNFSLLSSLLNNKKLIFIDENGNMISELTELDYICKTLIEN
jgi:hypothetical protein